MTRVSQDQCDKLIPDNFDFKNRSEIKFFTQDLIDFSDTAALATTLDLVITVDTSIAHLAGALGLNTWVLLPHTPDWRWMLARADSLWYPTMKLYRQEKDRDWNSCLVKLGRDLSYFLLDRSIPLNNTDLID